MTSTVPNLSEVRGGSAAVPGIAPGLPPSQRPAPAPQKAPAVIPAAEIARLAAVAQKSAEGQTAALERLRAVLADDAMAEAFARVLEGNLPAHDPVHFVHELLLHAHRKQAQMFGALGDLLGAHQMQSQAVLEAQVKVAAVSAETADRLQGLRTYIGRIADAQEMSMEVMEQFALLAPQLTLKIDTAAKLLDLQGLRGWLWLLGYGAVWTAVGVAATLGVVWLFR